MNQAPYRDIYHLLNRSLSGITLERYIKSGWQHFYTARAADGRRLDNFSDGLNNLERNAQDTLSAQLITKTLDGNPLMEAVLWLRHNRDPALQNYLIELIRNLLDDNRNITKFVLREFAGLTQETLAAWLKSQSMSQSSAYRDRFSLRQTLFEVYDGAVHQLELQFQSQGLVGSL
ncbi:hypothetical protein [Endozoicomonas sp. ALB091]|uniref:hypothetical protein n=1 Tax=Endozoicomonas sp. ALB091 TaxID=3403073 RepID=UPI003BB4CE3A